MKARQASANLKPAVTGSPSGIYHIYG